jgi:hypothetical protein
MEDQSLTLRLLQPFDACPVTLPLDLLSMERCLLVVGPRLKDIHGSNN